MLRRVILVMLLVLIFGSIAYAQPSKVWKTGQTTSYYTGDDGDIEAGVAWPGPRFIVSGDCVTDNLTGLMWTKNANLPGTYKTWQQALDYANNLTLCGYSDWRLPNTKELLSLIDYSKNGPALPAGHPFINVQSDRNSRAYWLSTTVAWCTNGARYVIMWSGDSANCGAKTNGFYVWPVRSGQVTSLISISKPVTITTNGVFDYSDGHPGEWPSDVTDGSLAYQPVGLGIEDGVLGWQNNDYNEKLVVNVTIDLQGTYRISKIRYNPGNVQRAESWNADRMLTPFGDTATNPGTSYQGAWTEHTGDMVTSSVIVTLEKTRTVFANDWLFIGEIEVYGIPMITHSISGVVTANGSGLGGVTLTLSGTSSATTTTASDGTYSFSGLLDGSYTLTPAKTGYNFVPPSRTITISGADVTAQDFSACPDTLSGTLKDAITNRPLSAVNITVDGIPSATTDSNGLFSVSGLSCGGHTVEVSVSGYYDYIYLADTSANPILNILLTKRETVYGPDTPSGYIAEPVNTATGNYVFSRKDLEISGRGLPFVFERNYNSQDAQDGPLGFGWNHNYNTGLTVNPDSTITIRWGDGKTETWTPDGAGGFTPQYGVFDTLIDNGGIYTLKKKDMTKHKFDASGRLTSIIDKNGNTINLTYTGSSLTQVTDTVGRIIAFTYDANNHITLITDPIGRTVQFAYDTNGDLVSSTDRNGNATLYTYDANHQMLTATDPNGNTFVTNIYDSLKRVVTSQRDAKSGVTTYTYDQVNRKTTIVDQLGNTTIHYHDELLRLIQEVDARGNANDYTYDAAGNRSEFKDKNGNLTKYTYDSKGNVTSKTDALNNVTLITYDANNNPLTRTDAIGNMTTFVYDGSGNLIRTTDPLGNITTITYEASGLPLTLTDANGNTTTNSYDTEGNLTQMTDAESNTAVSTYDGVGRRLTATDSLGRTTTYAYDNNSNLLSVTDPLGNVTAYTYDGNNNRLTATDPMGNTTSYSYDVKDLLTTITDPFNKTITYTYDGLDRRVSVTDKKGNVTGFAYDPVGNLTEVTDPAGNSTASTYDANGNKLTLTDPLGNTTTYTYDALNRIVDVTDPLGSITSNAYDKLSRVVSTVDASGKTTTFEYDAMSRLTKVTDSGGGTVTYTYDANGNRLTMTDPKGGTTAYSYDALNRLVTKTEALGSQYQYVYNAVGKITSMTDPNGNATSYTYDALNRLVTTTYPDSSTVSLEYDANSNRTRMVDGLGTSTYNYDAMNRLISYSDPFGKTVAYGYDANGSRILLIYPDGKVVQYGYDALNRLTGVTDWRNLTTTYTYDSASELIGMTNPNNTMASYSYDAAGRPTGLLNTKADSTVISSYSYALDAIGNHTAVVQNEPLTPLIPGQNVAYTYDAENRMTSAGVVTNTFDANGNMTAKGSDTFAYDYNDRLVQSTIAGLVTQYRYDGIGNRLVKVEGGATTRYVQDINGSLNNVLAETDIAGAITAYYVYGLGLISKVMPDGTAHYYHYDSRGSAIALTDGGQTVTDVYAYDPFGNVVNRTGATANPYRYVGRYGVQDEGNGLKYMRARYYDSDLGRFLSKDLYPGSIKDSQAVNRYAYVQNQPVNLIDPSGFKWWEDAISVIRKMSLTALGEVVTTTTGKIINPLIGMVPSLLDITIEYGAIEFSSIAETRDMSEEYFKVVYNESLGNLMLFDNAETAATYAFGPSSLKKISVSKSKMMGKLETIIQDVSDGRITKDQGMEQWMEYVRRVQGNLKASSTSKSADTSNGTNTPVIKEIQEVKGAETKQSATKK